MEGGGGLLDHQGRLVKGVANLSDRQEGFLRNQEKGVFRRGFLQGCMPLLAVAV